MAEHWSWPVDVAKLLVDTQSMSPGQFGGLMSAIEDDVDAGLPNLRRLAILTNVGHSESIREMDEIQAARRAGSEVVKLEIRRAQDIAPHLRGAQAAG